MSNFAKKFYNSAFELRSIQNLCISAMLIGLSVILALFSITVTQTISIRFGFIALGMIGWLYGPVVGAICAGISDLLCAILIYNSGVSPWFFISAVLTGTIYGIVLYQHKITPVKVIIVMAIVGIFVNMLLNTYWNSIMYGDSFFVLLPPRILKNIATIVLNSIIFYAVSKPLNIACKKLGIVKA